jgi:type I restriction enzyme M protein
LRDFEKNGRMTFARLEIYVWGADDMLRGSIDAADYKHDIFSLLLYRRISDV